ncbi:hypothetical protein K504DRAFT_211565 [Pleomassaria siparia CBS 279.74]|uniref:Rhodopsin domain-containing protein n=1 Tax=Pleomassaria siparia CBS 279.74 TaxID=1314801 RepID=A0A6G1KJM9_9PLEO|nr:hypothetical protein K504DRAFT_211565 [Pleomassaria siparia CBS 279.74]
MPPPPFNPRQRAFLAAHVILGSLATLFVAARFAAKRMKRLGSTTDDHLLLVATFAVYVIMANSIASLILGSIGQHASAVTQRQLKITLVILWANQFPHAIALCFTRCSISLLFLRIFYMHVFPRLRITAYMCIIASVICLLIRSAIVLLHCRPFHHNWAQPVKSHEHCYPLKPATIALAIFGLIIDGVTWIMPHFVVWGLQLRKAHKIAITSIFALGLMCEDWRPSRVPSQC